MSGVPFHDRQEAGQRLGERLTRLSLPGPRCVLALPRGGVPVGVEVARALEAPLEVLLVRKIGVPSQPELAVAAVVEGDPPDTVIDHAIAHRYRVPRQYIEAQATRALEEIARRCALYRHGLTLPALTGQTVVVVDDGIATGTTMQATLKALRKRRPARLVLAVPVAPPEAVKLLDTEVDTLVCLLQPPGFQAVGDHYLDFHQLGDDEVLSALRNAAALQGLQDLQGPNDPPQ